jgi:polysaccharide biosynthesis/export protein
MCVQKWMRMSNRLMRVTIPYLVLMGFMFLAVGLGAQPLSDPVIGPRDVLDIAVYNEPALSITVVVSESGEFSFPLLKRVKASGLSADALGLLMEERLENEQFLRNPSVTVMIKEQKFASVTISGAISRPGSSPIFPGMQLREFIAERGGVSPQAGAFIHIQRSMGELFKVDRNILEKGEQEEQNIVLQPGDQIMVPQADHFYVLGAVNAPGGFPLTRVTRLGEALGIAGGRKPNGGNILLWHHVHDTEESDLITFTFEQYQSDPTIRNATVSAGDSLYINQNDFVFLSGKVEKPGAYSWEPGMSVRSAIITAGGRSVVAGNTITLIREDAGGKQEQQNIKFTDIKKGSRGDLALLPGDIINVSANPILNIPYTIRRINPFSLPIQVFGGSLLGDVGF